MYICIYIYVSMYRVPGITTFLANFITSKSQLPEILQTWMLARCKDKNLNCVIGYKTSLTSKVIRGHTQWGQPRSILSKLVNALRILIFFTEGYIFRNIHKKRQKRPKKKMISMSILQCFSWFWVQQNVVKMKCYCALQLVIYLA